ncbi:MAG: 4Fe-4S binding protein [Synergistaceae bacterium]|nr:4Fe-4S binding protein [Synergistaceae bacterium]
MPTRYAVPDEGRCVSCGACTHECPKDAITIRKGLYAVVDLELCVGCGICARTCPADCIDLIQREAGDTA